MTRKEFRVLRRKEKAEQRFKKISAFKYKTWHKWLVKFLRYGGPFIAFMFLIYKMYIKLFVNLRTDEMAGTLDLEMAVSMLLSGTVIFVIGLIYLLPFLKRGRQAVATTRNLGEPSEAYTPWVLTTFMMLGSFWLFGLLYLFNYVAMTYGEALYNAAMISVLAFSIGFGSLIAGDIIEQSILKKVKANKLQVEHQDRLTTLETSKKIESMSEQLAELLG